MRTGLTIQRFYEWCKENNFTDYEIDIGYDRPDVLKNLSDSEEEYNENMDMNSILNTQMHISWNRDDKVITVF